MTVRKLLKIVSVRKFNENLVVSKKCAEKGNVKFLRLVSHVIVSIHLINETFVTNAEHFIKCTKLHFGPSASNLKSCFNCLRSSALLKSGGLHPSIGANLGLQRLIFDAFMTLFDV